MKTRILTIILTSFFGIIFSNFAQNIKANYTFIKKINLRGPARWDYLTMDGDRLFVSNNDRVHIINLKKDSLITTIANFFMGIKGFKGC